MERWGGRTGFGGMVVMRVKEVGEKKIKGKEKARRSRVLRVLIPEGFLGLRVLLARLDDCRVLEAFKQSHGKAREVEEEEE
jgi:hypothetical protein